LELVGALIEEAITKIIKSDKKVGWRHRLPKIDLDGVRRIGPSLALRKTNPKITLQADRQNNCHN